MDLICTMFHWKHFYYKYFDILKDTIYKNTIPVVKYMFCKGFDIQFQIQIQSIQAILKIDLMKTKSATLYNKMLQVGLPGISIASK